MISFAQFTADYPEFASASQAQFTLYQTRAQMHLNDRWGTPSGAADPTGYSQYDIGMELVLAHFLTRARLRALAGAAAGIGKGVVSAESAGPGSLSYDTASATEEAAGHWNETDYGREYVQMARLIGAGATQAAPDTTVQPNYNGSGWVGPSPYPGYFA